MVKVSKGLSVHSMHCLAEKMYLSPPQGPKFLLDVENCTNCYDQNNM